MGVFDEDFGDLFGGFFVGEEGDVFDVFGDFGAGGVGDETVS